MVVDFFWVRFVSSSSKSSMVATFGTSVPASEVSNINSFIMVLYVRGPKTRAVLAGELSYFPTCLVGS